MKLRPLHLLGISFLILPAAHAQIVLIDQQNDPQPVTWIDSVAALSPIQTFIPTLTGIDFADFVFTVAEGVPAQLRVQIRNGVGGAVLGMSAVVEIPGSYNFWDYYRFDFQSRIALTPGQTYALQVIQVSGNTGWIMHRHENTYPNGTAYWDGVAPMDYDYNFREGIVVVPEPATGALVSLCLAVCLGRRQQLCH